MTSNTEPSSGDAPVPLTVSVAKACELSGFGPTSVWAFLKDGRLEAVRVPGIRRTLITYRSLMKLLAPSRRGAAAPPPRPASQGFEHRGSPCAMTLLIRVSALVVVSCGGPHIYVPDCQFCSGAHCHSGCLVPVCSRCAIGKHAGFFSCVGPWDCDPRKTVLVDETWGGKKFCGRHEYHLTLADDPPRFGART